MRCASGKHEWLSEASAARCCVPGWRRVLRLAADEPDARDATDGKSRVDGEGAMFVWRPASAEQGRKP